MNRSFLRWAVIVAVLAVVSMPAVAADFDRQVDENREGSMMSVGMFDGIADLFQDVLEMLIAPLRGGGADSDGGGSPPRVPPPVDTINDLGSHIDPNGSDRL